MKISFDKQKNDANQEKHGVSLALADKLEWEYLLAYPDQRYDYCVVYTLRETTCRIISLRKANYREVDYYESHYSR
jgi:uncharacterized DUF497 family protein